MWYIKCADNKTIELTSTERTHQHFNNINEAKEYAKEHNLDSPKFIYKE